MVESISLELSPRSESTPLLSERATLLAAIADPLRLAILHFLDGNGEQCVCDIQEAVPIKANLLSYHLKTLREAGLLECERRGRWVHYWVAADARTRLVDALPLTPAQDQR